MSDTKPKRAFKGIWIPKELWLAEDLSLQEKVFLAEIDSLDRGRGCYASNNYFAKFFGLSKKRVSFIINSLCEKERIKSEIDTKSGNKRMLWTYPRKQGYPIPENGDTPIPENEDQDNIDNSKENKKDNSKDSSLGKLSGADAQDQAYRLLIRFSVSEKVARSIVYEQQTPPESIEEVIKNGLAKEKYQTGFVLTAGYIVAALNGARKEGKVIKSTRNSKKLMRHINNLNRKKNWKPPNEEECAERKRRLKAALAE